MARIQHIRPVLLSAPYAVKGENLELELHLQSGYRTTGMVEITLENGIKGLGEGYLAVFAPKVFVSIVELITPYLLGRDVQKTGELTRDLSQITDYWSLQGAARHVVSAFEIALQDCCARLKEIPVFQMLGASTNYPIQLYGSGGDSPTPVSMTKEFEQLEVLGIRHFKIRGRKDQIRKVKWCMDEGLKRNINIAVDMTQNLAIPGQHIEEIAEFLENIDNKNDSRIFFLEEVLGVLDGQNYPSLRNLIETKIAGGEIVTTPQELISRIEMEWYDIAQPDATVIGGISSVLQVFQSAKDHDTEVIVHCWSGPVGMMANYHAAIAGGGTMAEWPMPQYPLRHELLEEPWQIDKGLLYLPDSPGLGVKLTKEIENKYPFREDATYSCLPDTSNIPEDDVWKL